MYFHSRDLKYVQYGKVFGHSDSEDFLDASYRWLGHYCGFYPQVWLGRASSSITGYKYGWAYDRDVMFGFDYIKGFSVDYEHWHFVMNAGVPIGFKYNFKEYEKAVRKGIEESIKEREKEGETGEEWGIKSENYEDWRDKELFVKNDQVVVPSLNLKAAKVIYCKKEGHFRKLRKMGFIKDRLKLMPVRSKYF